MYHKVLHPPVSIDSYLPLLSDQFAEELTSLAGELGHLRFVHLNSTETGGGVAEILQSMVPLMNALGIATERIVIDPPSEFFQVTKRIHNLLQGAEGSLSKEELEIYYGSVRQVAEDLRRRPVAADVWFFHDPQLLPLAGLLPRTSQEVRIWIGHIDFTTPNPSVLDTLLPLVHDYDRLIFSLPSYVPARLSETPPVSIAPPAIDPLSVKNVALSESAAADITTALGIDPARPLITQVSRFDLWKDPWGVIDAFRLARNDVPGLQLALLGLSQATDDPEALDVLATVSNHAAQDPDIHLYFDASVLPCSIDEAVNAFQVASQVVIQKSTREGFGLTVTEAMWKAKPVIGGDVGGIRIQIDDAVSGYLVSSPEECAQRLVQLLQDPHLRARLGEAARESVRERFLMPRLAFDYLRAAKAHAFSAAETASTPST
jgi:trehalose synthase